MWLRDKLRDDINYAPYCGCRTMARMTKTDKGFKCDPLKMDHFRRYGCGRESEFDKVFLEELETLGWSKAVPEREVSAAEMDKILRDVGIIRS